MRPLKLRFKGLRSYRAEQEIDFTDVSLMAVVGDTGAGKSSLLEAVYFALYGGCTWDARSAKGLIAASGDGTLSVELIFRAKGKTWRVTRTTSFTNYPPSTHRLDGLNDNSVVDNAGPVNEAIRNLVGLDNRTFLRAVVLPQGRFQELLQTGGSERASALKSLLGLDELEEVRRQAWTLRQRLESPLNDLVNRRASLLNDPAGMVEDAGQRLAEARSQAEKLKLVKEKIVGARTASDEATRRALDCRTAARELTKKIPDEVDRRYQKLIVLEARLKHEATVAGDQIQEAERHEFTIKYVLTAADADGTGVSGTAKALATLKSLLDQIPGVEEEQRRLVGERKAISSTCVELDLRATTQIGLAAEVDRAKAAADQADSDSKAATDRMEACRTLLARARETVAAALTASVAVDQAHEELSQRALDLATAQRDVKQAENDFEETTRQFEAVSRANSAAHAASASRPGEHCPVCDRPLPDDFSPSTTSETKQLQQAQSAAQRRAKVEAERLGSTVTAHSTARTKLDSAVNGLDLAVADRGRAVIAAEAELGEVDLDREDDSILAALTAQARLTAETAKGTAVALDEANRALAADIAGLREENRSLEQREAALNAAHRDLEKRKTLIRRMHDTLPEAHRVGGELTTASLSSSKDKAEAREQDLREITDNLDAVRRQLRQARDKSDRLVSEYRTDVEQPLAQLSRQMLNLADASVAAAQMAGLPQAPPRPTHPSVGEEAQWAADVVSAVKTITDGCEHAATEQDKLAEAARSDVATAFTTAGILDDMALEQRLQDLAVDARFAERERENALDQQPLCDELDRRISRAKPAVDSLRDLHELLADGKFITAVVRRRQRALLGVASELFRSMTQYRFGFSDDFRIVDGSTGQPRDVKTLSGGETFLASLALALALVELTSRGGARVEALFLDEGFGTLDANVLSDALEALTQQAGGGRLVAVISHMWNVATHFDDILMVTSTLGGSKAHWLTREERDELVADETAGLLV